MHLSIQALIATWFLRFSHNWTFSYKRLIRHFLRKLKILEWHSIYQEWEAILEQFTTLIEKITHFFQYKENNSISVCSFLKKKVCPRGKREKINETFNCPLKSTYVSKRRIRLQLYLSIITNKTSGWWWRVYFMCTVL